MSEITDEGDLDAAMTETIRAKLSEINERPSEEPEVEAPAVAEKPPVESRERDQTGKFKPRQAQEAQPESSPLPPEAPAALGGETELEAPLVSTTGQPLDINRAPASWKPAAKAQWNGLPEPIRAEIYRRESDFLNGNKGLRENADFGATIKQVVEPYRLLIEAEGGTPDKAIGDTLRTAALFRVGTPDQKLNALVALDKQFNCGLVPFLNAEINRRMGGQQPPQGAQPQAQQPFADPRVDQILAGMQQQQRERAAQDEAISNSAVEHFMSAVNEKKEPLYPFVDNVLGDMSARVAALRRQNPSMDHSEALKQAYDAAVWANPETRAVLIGQQQAVATQPAETLRKVEQARRASATNVPKRGALPATAPQQSLDDTIRETARNLGMF